MKNMGKKLKQLIAEQKADMNSNHAKPAKPKRKPMTVEDYSKWKKRREQRGRL